MALAIYTAINIVIISIAYDDANHWYNYSVKIVVISIHSLIKSIYFVIKSVPMISYKDRSTYSKLIVRIMYGDIVILKVYNVVISIFLCLK